MNILGVNVPEELVTPLMRKTDWTPAPIGFIDDINPKWIGRRRTQIPPNTLRYVIWPLETEIEMLNRADYFRKEAEYFIHADGDPAVISEHILGTLRCLYIVACKLARGAQLTF